MIKHKTEIIYEINDYLRVDDFYSKLAERNSYIKSASIDDTALVKLNKECLDLAEYALKLIDWSKYKWTHLRQGRMCLIGFSFGFVGGAEGTIHLWSS